MRRRFYPVASITQIAAKKRKIADPMITLCWVYRLVINKIVEAITTQNTHANTKSFQVQFQPSTNRFPNKGMINATAAQPMIFKIEFFIYIYYQINR